MAVLSPRSDLPGLSSLAIEGSPTLDGRTLSAQDLPDIATGDIDKWIALARRLRGQYSIIARAGNSSVAVTDLSGGYPVFLNSNNSAGEFGSTLESVTKSLPGSISGDGLTRFAAFGSVGSARNLVAGVRTLPGASVTIHEGGSTTTTGWSDWLEATQGRTASASELEDEFRSIVASWAKIYLPKEGRVALLLSAGTDSGLLAALMKPLLGDRLVAITQTFFLDRYTELAGAQETAGRVGIPLVTARIGRSDYFRAVGELNSRCQDSVVHHAEAHNMYCLADFAKKQGIDTIITGYNADYLFLGLGHFFSGFPQEREEYKGAIAKLSVEEKLMRAMGVAPALSHLSRELLGALRIPVSEYRIHVNEVMTDLRNLLEPFARVVDLPTLQQLRGQIDGGVAWQDEQGCLSVMRSLPGCKLLCPFYDPEMIRFALRLPRDLIFNEGKPKYLLRQVFKAATGLERPKRPASMSPVRLWRMLFNAKEYSSISGDLRKLYLRLSAQNLLKRGELSTDLTKTAALGIWLTSHQLRAS